MFSQESKTQRVEIDNLVQINFVNLDGEAHARRLIISIFKTQYNLEKSFQAIPGAQ